MSTERADRIHPEPAATPLGLFIGIALVLIPMLARAQGPLEWLPYWESSPLIEMGTSEVIGFTPMWSMLFDAVSLVGVSMLLWCGAGLGRVRALPIGFALVCAGSAGAVYHGWLVPQASMKTMVIASGWMTSVAGAMGLWYACREERARLVVFALLTSFTVALGVKGLWQYAVEHPQIVQAFRQNKEQILAANGWTPDSPMARSYERRILQAEASGWFGLSNVLTTFIAMGFAGFLACAVAAWRIRTESSPRLGWLLTALTCAASVVLFLCGSKAGFVLAVMATVLILATAFLSSRKHREQTVSHSPHWLGMVRWFAPACVAMALGAVFARGLVGERIGELSMLFRSYYISAAIKIFTQHPLVGVGPDGFQEAYSIAKTPISPEDVTSPHSLGFDWAACLGVFGLAWVMFLGYLIWSSWKALVDTSQVATEESRILIRMIVLTAACSLMLAIPFQYATLLPEDALVVRLGGLLAWCGASVSIVILAQKTGMWRVGLFVSAIVAAVHSQIELTGSLVQSGGFLLAVCGAAAAPRLILSKSTPSVIRDRGLLAPRFMAGVFFMATIGLLAAGVFPARAWERSLKNAWEVLRPAMEARDLAKSAAEKRDPSTPTLVRRYEQLQLKLIPQSVEKLPSGWPIDRSASQLLMQKAEIEERIGNTQQATRTRVQAAETVEKHPARLSGSKPELSTTQHTWLSLIYNDIARDPARPDALARSIEHTEAARALDPYTPSHAYRLMEQYARLGDTAKAQDAAREALKLHDLQRLDIAARGLSERERARIKQILALPVNR